MRIRNNLLTILGKEIFFLGNMEKKTLTSLNLDQTPMVSVGHPEIVFGIRFRGEACFTDTGWHCHDSASVGCVDSGMIGIRTESESLVASSGMVVFTPPGVAHLEAGMGTPVSGWVVYLPKNRIQNLPKKVCVLTTTDVLLILCKRIVSWGKFLPEEKTPEQKRLILTFLDELVAAKAADPLLIPFPQRKELCLVTKRIMESPQDMATIDYWADVAGMSRRSFTMYFKEETGLPFARWRQLVKLHESLKLLSNKKSVTEIAFDLGYESVSTFIATFRKQFGVSPTKYIRNENETVRAVEALDLKEAKARKV
jgi:AraC-like DNA-binding protein